MPLSAGVLSLCALQLSCCCGAGDRGGSVVHVQTNNRKMAAIWPL